MMRIKLVEILKFIVAAAIGFTIRVMYESSSHVAEYHTPCHNVKDSLSDLNLGDIHDQLRQPHQPSSIRDVIEFRYFNSTVIFDTHLGKVKTEMKQYHRSDIRDIIKQVENLMNAGVDRRYKMKNVINGFERIDPVRGKEYVIDLELIPETSSALSSPRIFRYSLVKPFSYAQMVSQIEVSPTKSRMINMVYILNEKDIKLIKSILIHHETHVIDLFPVNVTMFVCSKTPLNQKIRQEMDELFSKYKSVFSYKLNLIVNTSCTFLAPEIANKAVGLLGENDSRIVVLNANAYVTHQFLQRCSSVLSENINNIYSPIPFANFLHQSKIQNDEIGEGSGVWDHDNFEVVCIHKNVFLEGGGLKTDEFFSQAFMSLLDRLISLKKQVFRSSDPSVKVFYHNLKCKEQEYLKYSNISFCEERQRRTFQSQKDGFNSIKLK